MRPPTRAPASRTRSRHLAGLLLAAMLAPLAASAGELSLDGAWQFRQAASSDQLKQDPGARTWRAAQVPGMVHTDLLANRRIPDPYVGAPEAKLQWIGLADWEYRRDFQVDKATAGARRSDLVFEGLDTFAEVWLNGQQVLEADNAFRTWRVPVQGRLKPGRNELRVVLASPIRRMLPGVRAMPHKIAGNYPSPYGDEPKDAMTANFVRKPGYHYGWDWGPRYVTAGIWKPVRIESWDALRVDDLHIRQDRVDADAARLSARLTVDAVEDGAVQVVVEAVDPDGRVVTSVRSAGTRLQAGTNLVELPMTIERPRRWYPAGYGGQPLYRFRARVSGAGGVQAQAERRTGLRSVELRRDQDAHGRGMAFVVNGIEVFAKGANAIPFDAFAPRVPRARIERVLRSARDANMNMIRNWGGGYYEGEDFFELADELGLLVWQDFMFGGGMQPGYDPAFRANVVAEARDQVRRLRNHPSIVLWCGNNEEETAWKDWGHRKQLEDADPAFAAKVWQGYVDLFGKDLRQVVAEEGGGIAYWSSSPGNDLAAKANDPDNGDMHYWEVWGGPAKPPVAYLEVTPRFMSEYGLQGWPVMRTIRSFAKPADLAIDSPVIRAHQKFMAGEGNTRLLKYVEGEFGPPRDFERFVYLSQVVQAEGIALAALHHRASRPRTMGSLYWQLNDVWPGASWSGIDFFGRWKALQFHARRFFAPVAVAALRKDGRTTVTLLSDRTAPLAGTLRLRVFDLDGRLLRDTRQAVAMPALSATVALRLTDADLLQGADPRRSVAVFDLQAGAEPPSRGTVYFAAARELAWPDGGIEAAVVQDGEAKRLNLLSRGVARATWIDFGDLDAEVSDNALTLLPGEPVSLQVESGASLDALRGSLRVQSLADALSPRGAAPASSASARP